MATATLLFAAACGGDDDDPPSAGTATPTSGSQPTAAAQPTQVAQPTQPASTGGQKTYAAEPPLTIDPNKKYFATFKMDIGDIKVELYAKEAPRHVNSFVFLARDGYYDGVTFHRVLPGFVAQGGDPTGTGSGGPGYTLPLEVNPLRKSVDGAMAAARTQAPDTAGSQFFLNYGPQPALDPGPSGPGYTVYGQIIEGRDVLDLIKPRDPRKPADLETEGTKINTIVIEEQ